MFKFTLTVPYLEQVNIFKYIGLHISYEDENDLLYVKVVRIILI